MGQRDPLEPLRRMRRMAVDQARMDLADSLRAEEHAAAGLSGIEDEIRRETEIACGLDGSDAVVEQFARWLRGARGRETDATLARDAAEQATAHARRVLGAARAAERAVEVMQERQAAERDAAAGKAEQAVLDEAGQEARRRRLGG
jgi:flagellar export protein FliJ